MISLADMFQILVFQVFSDNNYGGSKTSQLKIQKPNGPLKNVTRIYDCSRYLQKAKLKNNITYQKPDSVLKVKKYF